jgi:hypothetical protein
MKKFLSFFIVSVFLFNIGGYYLWYRLEQHCIQKEIQNKIREGMNDNAITLIILPADDETGICWIKPNKEFRYKSEMYDVIKIQSKQHKKFYYCINDTKEKHLITEFNKTHNAKKALEKKIKRIFTYNLFINCFSILKNQNSFNLTFTTINFLYNSNLVEIHSPPPKSI